jgi:hypothetical protein
LIILKHGDGMMGYVSTKETGGMSLAVLVMVKDRGKDGEAECNEQNGSKPSEIGAAYPYHWQFPQRP